MVLSGGLINRCIKRATLLAALMLSALVVPAARAAAASSPLAEIPNAAQQLTAYDGYVVFSEYEPNAGDWHLMVWHSGAIKPLPVAARDMPFDADAGPAADGKPAVVFSRCAEDPPRPSATELQTVEYLREPDWAQARGCRIYELALPAGVPTPVAGIDRPGASDSTPAIWDGDISFARLRTGSHVARLYLWSHSAQRVNALGSGPAPICPAGMARAQCRAKAGGPLSAWVGSISLDAGALAYEWIIETAGPAFGIEGAEPEIRVDPLRAGRQSAPSLVAETSFVSGLCGFVDGDAPSVVGNGVLYGRVSGDCEGGGEEILSRFTSYSERTHTWRASSASAGVIAAIAQDHATTYWIRDVPKQEAAPQGAPPCRPGYSACALRAFEYTADCNPAHGACTLMRTTGLTFGSAERRHAGAPG